MSVHPNSLTNRTERHLLILAGAFLGIYSISLTLSDAARLRTWQVDYRWQHWFGFIVWVGFALLTHRKLSRLLPRRDPFVFPIAAILTGWGMLTIWRLSNGFGLRQSIWLLVIGLVILLASRSEHSFAGDQFLQYLRRFKYIWLTTGILLTAATLVLGTNPMGGGPRLWLGCCGFYIQPSEPLKLLLIIYLAAYLADRQISSRPLSQLLPLLIPTIIMTGLAMLLLIFQRDLGTAALFLALYAIIVYAGTGNYRVLILSFIVLILASAVGYALFDVVDQRVDAWINPWIDPSGRSYQIVQSLLAFANGGLVGRGPGMGSPGLVPIAHSDFIFSAIGEESGLLGVLAVLGILALLVNRGTRIALNSADSFHRLLASGLVVHLVGQSILIIAGNLRLLPLTGVTLPFVSYGGSSLVVSYIELLCLLLISNQREEILVLQPDRFKSQARTSLFLSGTLMLGLASAALVAGWWALVRGPDLLTRTDNPRRAIVDRYVMRGSILDQQERPLVESRGLSGEIVRNYPYPALGPIVGYTHPVYGQAGLEAALDLNLRGLQGYPELIFWWERLLYGFPPPGLDVRLSIDLDLQTIADQLLSGNRGAVVLLNAHTGEILVIASSPDFNANTLDTSWEDLINDPDSPLFDRAGMGLYPAGNSLAAFLLAANPGQALEQSEVIDSQDCALMPDQPSMASLISAGCPEPLTKLVKFINEKNLISLMNELGFFTAPVFPIETLSSSQPSSISDAVRYLTGMNDPEAEDFFKVSPLQMALAVASLSNKGVLPSPRLVMSVESSQSGWVMASAPAQSHQIFEPQAADDTARALAIANVPIWQVVVSSKGDMVNSQNADTSFSWYLGGTSPEWKGAPLAVVVLLEKTDPNRVQNIGRQILHEAMNP